MSEATGVWFTLSVVDNVALRCAVVSTVVEGGVYLFVTQSHTNVLASVNLVKAGDLLTVVRPCVEIVC